MLEVTGDIHLDSAFRKNISYREVAVASGLAKSYR